MAKPNVNVRNREIGFVSGQITGSFTNTSGTGLPHNTAAGGPLNPGVSADSFGFQINHAILGGGTVLFVGNATPPAMIPTRSIAQVHDTHCVYAEIFAHLRSAGNVDLPAEVRFFFNELWPDALAVPNPTTFDLGDWVTAQWQEWEKWSPLTIPTPPPGFTGGGAAGIRYEYRRHLGRVPGNFMFMSVTNRGTVAATEWGVGLILRNQPEAWVP